MRIEARNYGRTVILHLDDAISPGDVKVLTAELPEACKAATHVVIAFNPSKLAPGAKEAMQALQEQFNKGKPRVFVAAPGFETADAKDLAAALDLVGSTDADRLIKLFARGHELVKLRDKLASLDAESSRILKLPEGASAKDFELALSAFRAHNRKVRYLYKVLGGEIELLKRQRAAATASTTQDPATQSRLNEVRERALALLKG